MVKKDKKLPEDVVKELDINEVEDIQKEFKVSPIIEPHQIKLQVPRQLVRDLELEEKWKNKDKIKLYYDEENNELRYEI